MNILLILQLVFFITIEDDLHSLINAERAFSALSARQGIKTAFLTYLDNDVILFTPTPTKGKQRYKDRDSIPGLLTWEPQFAFISSGGDLGFTTGPWVYKYNSDTGYGHFVSVWEKKNNIWNVILDTGIDYAKAYESMSDINSSGLSEYKSELQKDSEMKELRMLDTTLNTPPGYQNILTDDIRFYRMNLYPFIGKNAVLDYINKQVTRFKVEQQFVKISGTGDLAFSYGYFEYDNDHKDVYLRIWTRTKIAPWKLTLELAKPVNE